ncbi:MAG: epoxyqueuosine reductase, partial [Desulfobacteraceae bacterium]|nr:epoxyqueuosine reductase [Desulfobacteraceae bacterium]
RTPLLATARADKRFEILPRIAAPDHALPQDLLPTVKSVVSFFIPLSKEIAKENHKGEFPSRSWGKTYEATNKLIENFCRHIKEYLSGKGYETALTPATHNFDPKKLVSQWSHKHLGYICGIGRFGVNAQLITPSGCAGRYGSLVTNAPLEDSPLVTEKELCLYKNGHKCLVCAKRCPVKAVRPDDVIDRQRCWKRLNYNRDETDILKGLEKTTHVCGKCQVVVPCSFKIPQVSPKKSSG